MSPTGKKSSYHDNKNSSKSSVKKKLNFDPKLKPNLKIAYPPHMLESSKKDILSDENKQLLVSEWLITHEKEFAKTDNITLPCSPILGSSFTKRSSESPVVENPLKRPRRQCSEQNDLNQVENSCQSDVDCSNIQDSVFLSPSSKTQLNKFQMLEKSPDIFLSESPTKSPIQKSPILGRRKPKRRRNLLRENKTNNQTITTDNSSNIQSEPNISTNTIPDVKSNLTQIEDETFFEHEKIEEEKEEKWQVNDNETVKVLNDSNASQIIDDCEEISNPDLRSEKMIKIEIESASSSMTDLIKIKEEEIQNDSTFIEDVSESEKSESFIIEDSDTPAVLMDCIKEPLSHENLQSCKSPRDSQDTYFSKAESQQSQAIQPSQRISEISSTKINHPNSCEVNIISNETSSPKPILEPFSNILKSEKKKRRVKKGSFVEKLRTLVNREISFLRIWHHQVKQSSFQNLNNQFVELCIQKLYNAYSRQFVECCLISDKCNLLKCLFESDTEIINDSQDLNTPKVTNKTLTIMIVPEIVNELKAKNGDCLKVHPPWEVVDKKNLILSVMYFTIDNVLNFKMSNDKEPKENLGPKRIESFDCPCIEEGKIVENCNRRFANTKPNVIQEIFNSS